MKHMKRELTPPPSPPSAPPAPRITKKIEQPKVDASPRNGSKGVPSIFRRLGSKGDEELVTKTKSLTVTKPAVVSPSQRVLFVKKIPAKATMPHSDEEDEEDELSFTSRQKSVSFGSVDEVMEFSARKTRPQQSPRKNIRSRLGDTRIGVKQPIKAQMLRKTTTAVKPTALRSDAILKVKRPSVHERINLEKSSGRQLPSFRRTDRISNNESNNGAKQRSVSVKKSLSVFERLGNNRK